ncbi:MAG: hypothetical protein ABJZ55_12380 [Fuerstiella sp.]
MRFQTTQRPRGLLKARDQRRLVLLTLAFGLLMVTVSVVRHPQLWASLFPQDTVIDANTVVADNSIKNGDSGNNGSATNPNGLRQDEFWSTTNSADNPPTTHPNLDVVDHRVLKLGDKGSGLKYDKYGLPQVPEDLIADVKDNVIGVHSTEATAYNASMGLASKLDAGRESKAELGKYALFIDAPKTARGRAFKIEGKLRRLTLVKGRVDAFRIGNVYDAWLNTDDSGTQMMHVVASQVDQKLARYLTVEDRDHSVDFNFKTAPKIHFTGYFFKKEAYASQNNDGLSVAPMFVTATLQKTDMRQKTAGQAEKLTPYLWWLAFFVMVAITLIVWSFAASDAAHLNTRAHQLTRLPAVTSFDEIESETVDETLHRLQSIDNR